MNPKRLLIPLGVSAVTFATLVWVLLYLVGGDSSPSSRGGGDADRDLALADALAREDEPAGSSALFSSNARQDADTEGSSDLAVDASGGAVLYGRVTAVDGTPIAGARVLVRTSAAPFSFDDAARLEALREQILGRSAPPAAADSSVARAVTDRAGHYSFPLSIFASGWYYQVHASAPDFAPESEQWSPVSLAESVRIDLRLGAGETIQGIVRAPDGSPVARATVRAFADGGGGGFGFVGRAREFVDETESDEDGRFVLRVRSGTFRIEGTATGFSEGTLRDVRSGSADLELFLESERSIAARVLDANGQPMPGVEVAFFSGGFGRGGFGDRGGRGGFGDRGDRGGRGGRALTFRRLFQRPEDRSTTDASGTVLFHGVDGDGFLLVAEHAGYVPAEVSGGFEDDKDRAEAEIRMIPGRTISGVVTDPNGRPVPRALVLAAPDGGNAPWERFRGRGRGRGGRDGDDGTGSESQSAEDLERERQRQEERAREPLPLYLASAAAETDAQGRFALDTLAKTQYALSVQADEFIPHRVEDIDLEKEKSAEVPVVLDPGLTLRGRVVSSRDATAVSGASVSLRWREDRRRATADDDGYFAIAGLVPGEIGQLEIDAVGFSITFVDSVELAARPAVQEREFPVDPNASIAGRVVDAAGNPISHARVRISQTRDRSEEMRPQEGEDGGRRWEDRRQEFRRRFRTAVAAATDADGQFLLAEVNPAPALQLRIEHSDFKEFESAPFSVAPGERLEKLRFELNSGARLNVLVRGPDREPLAGVRVLARLEPVEEPPAAGDDAEGGGERRGRRQRFGGRGGRPMMRTTGPDGGALFAGIDGGRYRLTVTHRGFQPASQLVDAVEGNELPVVLALLPENTITGIVQDTLGNPLDGARVRARRETEELGREESTERTLADGTFRLGSLGAGAYRLEIEKRGYVEKRLEAVEVFSHVPVVLEALGEIRGVVASAETGMPVTEFTALLQLRTERASEPEPGGAETRARGAVFQGGRGQGLAAASGREFTAEFRERFRRGGMEGGGRRPRRFNDPDGRFVLSEIPPGEYQLEILAPGYTGTTTPVTVGEGPAPQELVVELLEGLSARGVVLDAGGKPLPGAAVYLLAAETRAEERDALEASRTRSLEERRDELRRERERRRDEMRTRRSGAERDEELLDEAAGLLVNLGTEGSTVAQTDGEGAFAIREVPEGAYLVLVQHESHLPRVERIFLRADRSVRPLSIRLDRGEVVSGTISFAEGRSPAAGVTVVFTDSRGMRRSAVTDERGRYAASGFRAGAYGVRVLLPGGGAASTTFTAQKSQNRFDYEIPESAVDTSGGGRSP